MPKERKPGGLMAALEADLPQSAEVKKKTSLLEDKKASLIEDEVTKQWGKRASSKYSQINGLIPSDLKKQFKAKVALDGSDISKKIEELIRDYVNS